jgi:microcystin-dependent protein
VLLDGEPGIELNTGKFKLGTGTGTWNNLEYAGNQGLPGTASTVPETTGVVTYAPTATTPAGWLPCNGSLVSASTIPALQSLLPSKPGFSGGVGAQYGTGASQGIVVSASGVSSSNVDDALSNVDDGLAPGDGSSTYMLWTSNYSQPNGIWLKFAFPVSTVINTYWLADHPLEQWSPTAWAFQGSNDNTNWTTLHTVDNGTPINTANSTGPISTSSMANFSFTNTTAYAYYRWIFTNSSYGFPGFIRVSEAAMGGPVIAADTATRVLPTLDPIVSSNTTFYPYIKS